MKEREVKLREICQKYLNTQENLYKLLNYKLKAFSDNIDYDIEMLFGQKPEKAERTRNNISKSAIESKIIELEQTLDNIARQAKSSEACIPIEMICETHHLNKKERIILTYLFFKKIEDKSITGYNLVRVVSSNLSDFLINSRILLPDGTLRASKLIKMEPHSGKWQHYGREEMLLNQCFEMTEDTFVFIAEFPSYLGVYNKEETSKDNISSVAQIQTPSITFDNLILSKEKINSINDAIWQSQYGTQAFENYGLSNKITYGKATSMLFYGPPGTGKTATSEAIANKLGKKLAIASYNKIYDRWVGESEKSIVKIFEEAKKNKCVLLFDEAESIFGKRMEEVTHVDRMSNVMTNILMQQIEKYDGLVILTTNREVIIDKAFERRILLKLKFDMPSYQERVKIWEMFLKDCKRLDKDVVFDKLGKYELSGGKIKNIVIKSVIKCARQDKNISMTDLMHYAEEEINSDFNKAREIGFRS